MSSCCVYGCKNRQSSTSQLKFYRIPSGSRPFQANRRRLWLQAIQQANGSTEELKGNARICGAHFKSQEASMDHDSPDFVPSVFTYAKQTPKKKVKRFYSRRKRRRRADKTAETKEKTSPPRVDSPVDLQSSVVMGEMQTPPGPTEGEILTTEAETDSETTTIKSHITSSTNKTSPSFKVPPGFQNLDKRSPILCLKHVFVPAGGYQCEQCSQFYPSVSQLMKHKRQHEEEEEEESSFICEVCEKHFKSQADFTEHQCVLEPSFQCNMCDRSFTTSHNLKRHKLLHVKDGRKCAKCGVLFCQRHSHIVFLPLADSITEYEEDSTPSDSHLMPESHVPEKPEPSQTADLISIPLFLKPSSVSHLPPPVPRFSRNLHSYPANYSSLPPKHPELPPALKLFSPQYLTSALLEVKRNYEYILSKPSDCEKKNVVKEEPSSDER
ncbi:zinc finger protein 568-like isoform X2 [Etheostoma cragini]|uniref:zinc finger protein 568-like isoform X2 n=1 Tax=Etheostoma cragini TaxID=417921 RepID=UPI00155F0634|nr:zinc finger protein 568-like isoform X2 [Etheostoma cragini]